MKTQHTPGPWKIKQWSNAWRVIWDNPGFPSVLAEAFDPSDGRPNVGTAEANARLIAAAPDMYEALKLARYWAMRNPNCPNKDLKEIDKAISEAEGK